MNFYEQLFCRGRTTGEGMTHFERLFAAKFGGSPPPQVREYTGAVPVTITADGTPLLDFLISGNTVQNGTPTPDNPIMPQGTGERTAQLWDISSWDGATAQRATLERVTNGFRLTATSDNAYTMTYGSGTYSYSVIGDSEYTLSWTVDNPQIYGVIYIFTGTSVADTPLTTAVASSGSKTFTVPSGHNYVALRLGVSNAGDEITYTNIMLNTGSTAKPFEPYGYKIPISSANTTTPVYLGEVESIRRVKKLVLTGGDDENWNITNNSKVLYLAVSDFLKEQGTICYCTHYETVNNVSFADDVNDGECTFNDHLNRLYIKDGNYIGTQGFKNYLAQQYANGTPVTVWYVLATETTGIVNEPLMRIGDYADTLSKAQALVSIPTNNGSTTIDVDTTLKPSEVYIKYMG